MAKKMDNWRMIISDWEQSGQTSAGILSEQRTHLHLVGSQWLLAYTETFIYRTFPLAEYRLRSMQDQHE